MTNSSEPRVLDEDELTPISGARVRVLDEDDLTPMPDARVEP